MARLHPDRPTADARLPVLLVVEDEPGVADLIADALDGLGEVAVAGDAPDAMRLFGERRPDVVLLDVGLPGQDGFVLLQRIRAASDVPVVAVSGRAAREDQRTAYGLGVDMYVTKPFSPAELRARVEAILRRA